MREEILMPKMGESVMEGTLIKWYKTVGEKVKRDEIIFEISTDKVDTEVPSPKDGVLVEILLNENETADIGTVIAVLDTDAAAAVVKEKPVEKTEPVKREEQNDSQEEATADTDDLIDIPMPKMGESVMEGTIIKWNKSVGDLVKKDEIILEISTDKVDTEVPSPVAGTLAEIIFKENETAEVGEIIARISTSGKVVADPKKPKPEEFSKAYHKTVQPEVVEEHIDAEKERPVSNRFYSPLVLNIAKAENVSVDELATIVGTGLHNRVRKLDILKFIEDRKSGKTAKTAKPKVIEKELIQPKYEKGEGVEIIPMGNMRKRIMHHMTQSRDTSVHVSEVMEVDMSIVHNYIEKNRDKFLRDQNVKLTYMPFISAAVIKGIKDFPLINASLDGDNIVLKKYINLGIAVAVEPNGLIVPNIKNADEKNVLGLAKAINDLGRRARTKNLSPDDVVDGTFSITNYGVFGALFGNPIINQPEVAILGVGAVVKRAVVIEVNGADVIAIKPMMYLSLSHDHRLVDGMLGGNFLKSVKDTLENFDVSVI